MNEISSKGRWTAGEMVQKIHYIVSIDSTNSYNCSLSHFISINMSSPSDQKPSTLPQDYSARPIWVVGV